MQADLTAIILEKLPVAVAVFLAFISVGVLAQKIIVWLGKHSSAHEAFLFAGQAIKFTLFAIGLMFAVNMFEVNISAIFAGLGITGIVLGIALQNTLSNAVAGVLILTSRTFKPGDHIMVSGFEGKVEEIGLRYTTLESAEKKILVPNSLLSTNVITIAKSR
ncbi:MAG: mechanosensitive ion channel [Parcubacteria group bacterium GW2011_GWA2_45_30]|nr:MAG: mechanosensitive ion channel [Parcubacteria group bacterium GW2011_GWA2_45_30]